MYLCDGYSTILQIYEEDEGNEIIPLLRCRSFKLPGMNGGPPIDTHTMYNQFLVTKAAQGLVEYDDVTMQCQYDINAYVTIDLQCINQNRFYVARLPDNSTFSFWACMYKFDPAELRKGEFPLAEVTLGLLNRAADTGIETGPTIVSVNTGSDAWPPPDRPRGVLNR